MRDGVNTCLASSRADMVIGEQIRPPTMHATSLSERRGEEVELRWLDSATEIPDFLGFDVRSGSRWKISRVWRGRSETSRAMLHMVRVGELLWLRFFCTGV